MTSRATHVLTLSCADRPGIVAAVSTAIAEAGGNIEEAAQFGDPETGRFFMRVSISVDGKGLARLDDSFAGIGGHFAMDWRIDDATRHARVLIMVSRFDHCLNDLLYRHSIGALPMEIPAIVSNHRVAQRLAAAYNIPFRYLPVSPDTKPAQEAKLLDFIDKERIDLVVLARYMQILTHDTAERLRGRAINIHHSFLPSFKGARPYQQAHARGVKLIGATAHYVTADLDEGPIIEQDVARISHAMSAEDLAAAGRDVECAVLAKAVGYHLDHRVLLNGHKTVVFR